ncbi:MAG: tetratricopeptide repeat protein [Spirochaetales bacterium]|nr:tetratricopeptide repeat protein [Spirochaetales bacterium]
MARIPSIIIVLFVFASFPLASQSADQLYSSGRGAFTDGLWSTAASQLARLLREFPDDARADTAAYMEAVALFRNTDFQKSADRLSDFTRDYPNSAWNQRIAYWEGLSYYALEHWPQAIEAFQRQVNLLEEPAYREQSLLYLADSLEKVGQILEAEQAYQTVIDDNWSYEPVSRAVFNLGQLRLASGRLEQALESFRTLAFEYFSSPFATDAMFWIAECQRLLERHEAALDGYRDFLATVYDSPNRSHALLEAARLASTLKADDEALAFLDLRDTEGHGEADALDVARIRGASALRSGRLDEARRSYNAILTVSSDLVEIQAAAFDLAQTWIGTDEAINAVSSLLKASQGPNPEIAGDALYLAGTLLLLDEQTLGAETLERFAAKYPEDERREEALRTAWTARRESGDSQYALQNLDLLIEDYPQSPQRADYLYVRGRVAEDEGRMSAALLDYAALLDSFPEDERGMEVLYRIALVYEDRGEFARAGAYFLQASEQGGGAQGDELARRALYGAGAAFSNSGRSDEAQAAFSALAKQPDAPWGDWASYQEGVLLHEAGRAQDGRDSYQKALKSTDPQLRFDASFSIAWSWYGQGEWQKAAQAFEDAALLALDNEQRALAQYRAGLSRSADFQWEKALLDYERALLQGQGDWREEALYQQAWAFLQLDQEEEAFAISQQLLQEFPTSRLAADLPFRMGEEAMAQGDFLNAAQWFDVGRRLYPRSDLESRSALLAARAYSNAGDYDEASKRYGEWFIQHPEDSGASAVLRTWAEVIKSSANPNLADEAQQMIEPLQELRGEAFSAPLLLAWTRVAGIPSTSISRLELLAENQDVAEADRAEAVVLLAHAYRMEGKYAKAKRLYEVVVRDVPGALGAEAQEGLAQTLRAEGKTERAAEEYLSLTYLFPEEEETVLRALSAAERLYRELEKTQEAEQLKERRLALLGANQ